MNKFKVTLELDVHSSNSAGAILDALHICEKVNSNFDNIHAEYKTNELHGKGNLKFSQRDKYQDGLKLLLFKKYHDNAVLIEQLCNCTKNDYEYVHKMETAIISKGNENDLLKKELKHLRGV